MSAINKGFHGGRKIKPAIKSSTARTNAPSPVKGQVFRPTGR